MQAPRFEVDPFWPKPLPNHWVLGQAIGIWVDDQDVVWIINRGSATLADNEKALELKTGECCAGAPPVLAFDRGGQSRAPLGRARARATTGRRRITASSSITSGNVWIGGNGPGDSHILKFTQGRQVPRAVRQARTRAAGRPNAQGTTDVRRRQQRSGELRTSGEDLRRPEGQRGVRRRRLLQQARRGARRQDGRDQTLLGRVRQQAGRCRISVRTIRTRRRPSSSAIRCTAPICRTTASSTSAIASTIGSRCSAPTARS